MEAAKRFIGEYIMPLAKFYDIAVGKEYL